MALRGMVCGSQRVEPGAARFIQYDSQKRSFREEHRERSSRAIWRHQHRQRRYAPEQNQPSASPVEGEQHRDILDSRR